MNRGFFSCGTGFRRGAGLVALSVLAACQQAGPPVNLAVPANPAAPSAIYPTDYAKPLPDQTVAGLPQPSFYDPPLVTQQVPEESYFVTAYDRVNRPRIAVFVNRTLDGSLIGAGDIPITSTDVVRSSTGAVNVQHSEAGSLADAYHGESSSNSSQFQSNGPAEYHETTTTWLHPGQYDEAALQSLDYSEMESLLTDWMRCEGQVTLVTPGYIRSQMSPQQVQDLQSGKPAGLADIGQATQADVLVQVQAHPTKRGNDLVVSLIAEAVNIRGGQSIASASVEMPTPIDRIELNNYTRFVVRKLMYEMVGTWGSAPLPEQTAPTPTTPPTPATPTTPATPMTPTTPVTPVAPATQP